MPGLPRLIAVVLWGVLLSAQTAPPEVPNIDAGAGACWVDFAVTQDQKPVYNAKIHGEVRWGWVHKTDVEIGTNYEGKARIGGLPQKVRKPPISFDIRKDSAVAGVTHDPATNCHASYDVKLPSAK